MSTALIGQPLARIDGPAKVTGAATYAYEFKPARAPVYGFIVPASIAKGTIRAIDTQQAERASGVLGVMTYRNAPAQPGYGPPRPERDLPGRFERARPALIDDKVRYWGEPVALVVAESFEAARHAALLVRVDYEAEPQRTDLYADLDKAYKPRSIFGGRPTDAAQGDFDAAFAAAPVTVEATYRMPYQAHNAMEPHAALADWDGGQMVVHTSTQAVAETRTSIAATLQLPVGSVRVLSPFVGGGFGGKLGVQPETTLACLAARVLGRPVKVAQTRQQMFHTVGHRPANEQTLKLGATRDGRLTAISHDAVMQSAPFDEFPEQIGVSTRGLYAAPNRSTRHRLVNLDMQSGESMRAPGEAPGMLALETAMDEIAVALDMDPVELRIVNDVKLDPERNVPFSSRQLVRCLREGAERFGWNARPRRPGTLRDGRFLVGYGVASAIRANYVARCEASATLDQTGIVTIRTDMTDIGTGSYTILTQVAADTLGLSLRHVAIRLADSQFPRSPGAGGSWGAASAGSAVQDACARLRSMIIEKARSMPGWQGYGASDRGTISDDAVTLGHASVGIQAVAAAGGPLEALGQVGGMAGNPAYRDFSQHAFGAHFAEVGVDVDTGEVRVRRMLGVFAAGRILNPRTARSQLIGGMIWGLSSALHEDAVVDPRFGQFVNRDLAGYHVPVHADIKDIEAFFVPEEDDKGNPLGVKGIGELGICGSAAAVGNAVFNAIGLRVRDFPITLDRLLPGLRRLDV